MELNSKKSILFVCSGNVFRSMSAEYLLKKYFRDNKTNNWKVYSAGIVAINPNIHKITISSLKKYGIDASKHKIRKVDQEMIDKHFWIVAMAENHKSYIESNFLINRKVWLFNEIFANENTSILDLEDFDIQLQNDEKFISNHIEKTVDYIANQINRLPNFLKKKYEICRG